MRVLNNADFLALWESGQRLRPLDRGLLALCASLPAESGAAVADWPLGRRNQALAELRALYFGPRLQGWTTCSQCGEKLEFEIDCRNLIQRQENSAVNPGQPIVVDGHVFRLPTSRDLARIANEEDSQQGALRLLRDCELGFSKSEETVSLDLPQGSLSLDDLAAVSEQMALADPLAEIALGFECPNCTNATEEVLDLSTFLWTEIESRAKRLLFEIHALASAYGWEESQILAMSDMRRTSYLQMVHG